MPAMPQPTLRLDGTGSGLTKREYFAAKAMVGLLNNDLGEYENATEGVKNITETSIEFADALLKKLDKD